MANTQKKRCAIYTRKSVEEGLDMEFNSLDAQRLAAENYVASQSANGWICLPERYDDGGFSGGNLERPALKKLLDDAANGLVDIIVIYKLDRLSRSICDFAELSKKFDEWGVSFVSVTQEINTSTSSGRMMLNILMTFAQYEREIIAERIRDKMSASRKRGQWVGGSIPFGYFVKDRHLLPDEKSSEYIRLMFETFVEKKSARDVAHLLNIRGIKTRQGKEWTASHIYRILNNRTYIGEVAYKGGVYPGEHEALVDRTLWDSAQEILKTNAPVPRGRPAKERYSPLKGLIRCGHCDGAMGPTYSVRRGRQYNYYMCLKDSKRDIHTCPVKTIPAGDVEKAVVTQLGMLFYTPTFISMVATRLRTTIAEVRNALGNIGGFWDDLFPAERDRLLHLLVESVTVLETGITIKIKTAGMRGLIKEVQSAND
ncbi:MAG: recombinase family protein [Desulfobacterales bacterium]